LPILIQQKEIGFTHNSLSETNKQTLFDIWKCSYEWIVCCQIRIDKVINRQKCSMEQAVVSLRVGSFTKLHVKNSQLAYSDADDKFKDPINEL